LLAAAQLLQAAELADVGIAAAAGAQDGGADGECFDVVFGEIAHLDSMSPTTLTRTRVALPRR
jgi:hypothetical protein